MLALALRIPLPLRILGMIAAPSVVVIAFYGVIQALVFLPLK